MAQPTSKTHTYRSIRKEAITSAWEDIKLKTDAMKLASAIIAAVVTGLALALYFKQPFDVLGVTRAALTVIVAFLVFALIYFTTFLVGYPAKRANLDQIEKDRELMERGGIIAQKEREIQTLRATIDQKPKLSIKNIRFQGLHKRTLVVDVSTDRHAEFVALDVVSVDTGSPSQFSPPVQRACFPLFEDAGKFVLDLLRGGQSKTFRICEISSDRSVRLFLEGGSRCAKIKTHPDSPPPRFKMTIEATGRGVVPDAQEISFAVHFEDGFIEITSEGKTQTFRFA